MPWQGRESVSAEERTFREEVEQRKQGMLARRVAVRHPVLLTERELEQARRNIRGAAWARRWLEEQQALAEYVVGQGQGYAVHLIPDLTPWTGYTFVCPNCIGDKSQEGAEYSIVEWDYRRPDQIRCRRCGHPYPSDRYPESGRLVCPRRGQTLTFYLNDEERRHPGDRSGRYAYQWAGRPIHACFSGIARERRVNFAVRALKTLALVWRLTGDGRYAQAAVSLLARLAECFGNWLYHDYWDAVADCDPLYAAWHDRDLPLEWKRSLFTSAYAQDEPGRAAMLQGYWGAGRVHTTTGAVHLLPDVCLAYDLLLDSDGLRRFAVRERIETCLILEWVVEAEPFVGGRDRAENATNKAPRVYHAQAAVARCLGLPELAQVAVRGYQAIRDQSFGGDGYCHEAPSYNAMYLSELLRIPETLHGFRWPRGLRRGTAVDLYRTDPMLRLMLRAHLDQMQSDGRYLPLSDTNHPQHDNQGGCPILEIGLKRFPEHFAAEVPAIYRYRRCDPTEYALLHLDASAFALKKGAPRDLALPEICFPHWMTAILRHGSGPRGTALCLAFNPPGGHRHRDNLTLYYAAQGQAILGDLGYLWESPLQGWLRSSFSHNLVVVDDQEQLMRTGGERRPALRMMVTSPRVSVVEASAAVYPQCRDYRRLVALIKGPGGQTFGVDIFRVAGGNCHDYRLFSELASSDAGPDGRLDFAGVEVPAGPPLGPLGAGGRPEEIAGLLDARRVEAPPAAWQVTYGEKGRRYRLWMLSAADIVQVSHGPGQEAMGDARQVGRRVRYVDAIRAGQGLASTFVAVHEPSGPRNAMPIRRAVRLEVPRRAGPWAVAVRVEADWGTYLVLSEFQREAAVEGIRFQGKFGVICRTPEGRQWLLTCGAGTCGEVPEGFGFADQPARWRGAVVSQTPRELVAEAARPAGWSPVPEGVVNYVLLRTGRYLTGLPVRAAGQRRIRVDRFPLPAASRFELLAVRSCET